MLSCAEQFRQLNPGRNNAGRNNIGRNNMNNPGRNNIGRNNMNNIGKNNINNNRRDRINGDNHRGNMHNRRLDRGNIGDHNFGGLRRERPFPGSKKIPYRRNINNNLLNNNTIVNNEIDRNLNLAYYNPYAYLHPFYDSDGNLEIYNTVYNLDNECIKKCALLCENKDLECLNNCFDTCSFDENRGLDGDSLAFKESFNVNNNKYIYALLLIIVLFIIVFVFTKK
jgi:hypothetical protein